MKNLIETIACKIPHEVQNYHLIKKQDIYIPYCEIGISCLTKDTTEINLFFETILKLLNIGVNEINEIATILGVEYKLIKETIVDMIEQSYVITSENRLIMTTKGKRALANRQLVTISKRNINQINVNMITGEIQSNENLKIEDLAKNNICLNEEQNLTKDFLDSNYSSINEIYQKNQVEFNFFKSNFLQRELYKILEIAYQRLVYVKEELLILKNNESEDYEFLISGRYGQKYVDCLYRQVKDIVYSGMENFFERDWNFSQAHQNKHIVTEEEKQNKNNLLSKLVGFEEITEDIIEEYQKPRALIDNSEIDLIFSCLKEIEFEGVIISCERIRKNLSANMISVLNQIQQKEVVLLFSESEYDIKSYLMKSFPSVKKESNIKLFGKERIEKNYICFYPNVLIEFVECSENIFGRAITVIEGKIEFDANCIKNKMQPVMEECRINFERKVQIQTNTEKKNNQDYQKQYRKHRSKRSLKSNSFKTKQR